MNKPKAVFVGHLSALKRAYPENLRLELSQHVDLYSEDLEGSTLPAHFGNLDSTEVLFGTWGVPTFTSELLEKLPSLRSVYYAAGSIKEFATPEAFERGLRFFSSWEANAIPVSEFTLGAVIMSMKKVWQNAASVRETKTFRRENNMPGMFGSKIGLVSLGAVGKRVAEKLRHFDVKVLAYDPFITPDEAGDYGVNLASLEELFATCDVVSIHTPWIPETVGMINEALLRQMQH
jgi:phosphoglycerate dehydrogenase-like enzyme